MIKPLNGFAVIKPTKEEEVTASGIVLPSKEGKEKPSEGEVVAVCDSNLNREGKPMPIEVSVGDRVLFGRYSGEDVKVDGQEYKIVELLSIRAILS